MPAVVWARFSPAVAGSSDLADLGGGHAGGRGLLQSSVTSCMYCTPCIFLLDDCPSFAWHAGNFGLLSR